MNEFIKSMVIDVPVKSGRATVNYKLVKDRPEIITIMDQYGITMAPDRADMTKINYFIGLQLGFPNVRAKIQTTTKKKRRK